MRKKRILHMLFLIVALCFLFYNLGYKKGWDIETNQVSDYTADSIINILNHHIENDSVVGSITFEYKDTVTYYISKNQFIKDVKNN